MIFDSLLPDTQEQDFSSFYACLLSYKNIKTLFRAFFKQLFSEITLPFSPMAPSKGSKLIYHILADLKEPKFA